MKKVQFYYSRNAPDCGIRNKVIMLNQEMVIVINTLDSLVT